MNSALSANNKLFAANARVYHQRRIVREYLKDTLPREDCIALLKYQLAFAGKDVFDIGAGAGRTSIYLAPLARRYQAIDYSPVMVERFRRELPGVPIELADMRDLSRFPDADFDFALASNNVFDSVGHTDRLLVLREAHRLLRPGGILMFTSHNRDTRNLVCKPRLRFSLNPVTQARLATHWCNAIINHARLRELQEFADEYAIVNDEAHYFALLQYYIGHEAQRRQLAETGFDLLETFDKRGAPVPAGMQTGYSRWLLYVARKAVPGETALVQDG